MSDYSRALFSATVEAELNSYCAVWLHKNFTSMKFDENIVLQFFDFLRGDCALFVPTHPLTSYVIINCMSNDRVHRVLEKSLKVLEFWRKKFQALESPCKSLKSP